MNRLPLFAGALVVTALAGAAAGMAVSGPMRNLGGDTRLPTQPIVTGAQDNTILPDHYPLHTGDRVVEVGELALRGRLRDRGGEWWQGALPAYGNPGEFDTLPEPDFDRAAHEDRLIAYTAHPVPEPQEATAAVPVARARPVSLTSYAETPLPLAEPAVPTPVAANGGAAAEPPASPYP